MKSINSEQLCNIFFEIENKYKLLDIEIQNVKIWQASRMSLYYYLAHKYGIEEQAHTKITITSKLKKLSSYIFNSIIHNPFFRKKCHVVVFSHPRVKLVDSENIDIYTKYFIDDLKKQNINFLELESAFLGVHKKELNDHTSYTDYIVFITNIFKKFIPIQFTDGELKLIENINSHLSTSFGVEVDISNILIDKIRRFKIKNYLYKKLLKKLSPHTIYIVVSYMNSDIVQAAKDLKIKVVELQHGILSDFHLGYSYPNRKGTLEYFPDEFLVWNQYWKDLMKLPIDNANIKIKPFEFLEINKYNYKDVKKLNQIVVLSQGNIGNTLAQLVLENIELFNGLKVVYKLHPGEYDRYDNYKALNELIKVADNIEIVEDVDLHHLLASSKYQLGVNSTALLEGVEFGCETILFDISGVEYMNKFIEFYNLKKVNNMFISEPIVKDF